MLSTANTLHPSHTLVVRLDTLEKPSLLPKLIGFGVLKLCIDVTGQQPSADSNAHDSMVFLNTGQFMLPIVYGRTPEAGNFSEAEINKLPHLFDAFLKVRLFDNGGEPIPVPVKRRPSVFAAEKGNTITTRDFIVDSSVIGSLIYTIPYSSDTIKRLPLSEGIINDIKRGTEIGASEKEVVLKQVTEWMAHVFPPLKQRVPTIDLKFMLRYEDKIGVDCALDMLYNMPLRKSLLKTTKDALGPTSLFQSKYDNVIHYYKAYFRYLPGSAGPSNSGTPKANIADSILDDASLSVDPNSLEYNPVFNDNFSRTAGIELSPNACLLVVIMETDVLTSRKNGLVGAHFSKNEPLHRYWGMLPLLLESPFQKRPKSSESKMNLLEGDQMNSKPCSISNIDTFSHQSSDQGISPTHRQKLQVDPNYGLVSQVNAYFVNAGTHQVPLFYGSPPDDLIKSPNPMAWLLNQLCMECKSSEQEIVSSGLCFGLNNSLDAVAKYNTTMGRNRLNLSKGASAFINIIDPRLRRFCNRNIGEQKNANVILKDDCLQRLLKAKFLNLESKNGKERTKDAKKRDEAYREFRYNPDRKLVFRNYGKAFASQTNPEEMLQTINQNFMKLISEVG